MNPNEPVSVIELGRIDPIDSLERPPSQQLGVYKEQRRQAATAFDICCIFAVLGVLQVLSGVFSVFWGHKLGISSVDTGMLFGGGGVFGGLSNWAYKLSDNANTRLERIASDEKTLALINNISVPSKKDEEISKFLKVLVTRR